MNNQNHFCFSSIFFSLYLQSNIFSIRPVITHNVSRIIISDRIIQFITHCIVNLTEYHIEIEGKSK